MTDPYTAADVRPAAQALGEWFGTYVVDAWPDFEEGARAVLSALAEAGRLLPADPEYRWGVWLRASFSGAKGVIRDQGTEAKARAWAADATADEFEAKVMKRALGPWVEADEGGTT